VADASAFVEFLLRDAGTGRLGAHLDNGEAIHAPALCDVEIASALRHLVLRRTIPTKRAREALLEYVDLPVQRHGHVPLLRRIFELRDDFGAYDACYVSLAEELGVPLLTADVRLERAIRARRLAVTLSD